MANLLYPKGKQALLNKQIDMDTDTIKVALIDTSLYTYNAAHDFWNDVSAGLVGTPVTLTSPTIVDGVFDAADTTFTAVTGASVEALVIYRDSGVAGTSELIAYMDTGFTGSPGLPVTPNGGNIVITWNASGIFAL